MRAAVLLVAPALALPAAAQCAEWSDGFHASGTDSYVSALEVWDDGSGPALYAGGGFEYARDVEVNKVARWDGAQWSDLAGGLANVGNAYGLYVHDLEVHDDGSGSSLFVAGRFDLAGGVPVGHIARWDGTQWHALAGGVSGTPDDIWQMARFDDGSGNGTELYAVGDFSTAGGAPIQGVARWDGAQWHGVGNWANDDVRCAAVYDDGSGAALYVGGNFEKPFQLFDGVAKWDGTSWSDVGPFPDSGVHAFEVFDDGSGAGPRLFAGGSFGGSGLNRFAVWDGVAWADPGCSPSGYIRDLVALPDPITGQMELYLASSALWPDYLQRWSGSACQGVGLGLNDDVLTVTSFDDGSGPKLYAGGGFHLAGTERADFIASWDGTSWQPLSTGAGAARPVAALGVADVGGGPKLYGGVGEAVNGYTTSVGRLDGPTWTLIGDTDGEVFAVGANDDGQGERLYVGGSFTDLDGVAANRAAGWDGTSWSAVGSKLNEMVLALHSFDFGAGPELVAGGFFTLPKHRIGHFDGTAWRKLGAGFNKRVLALETYDEGAGPRLFAGGRITRKMPLSGSNIVIHRLARWDGVDWTAVHTNDFDEPVHALETFDPGTGPILVIGGEFATQGGAPGDGIVGWDGTNWIQLGSLGWGTGSGYVNALAAFNDGSGMALYAGGRFDTAGGVPVQNIARWDGNAWTALDAGIEGEVLTLAVHDDGTGAGPALYVGGSFRRADEKASHYVARWGRPAPCPPVPYCSGGVSSSGCVATLASTGAASASASLALDLDVSGADGTHAAFLFYGLTGTAAVPWTQTGSVLCVKGPLQRTGVQNTGGTNAACDGAFSLDWNAFLASRPRALGNPLSVGQMVWAQAWILDNGVAKGGQLSNALEIGVHP